MNETLKATLLRAMEAEFGADRRRIGHARAVLAEAEKLLSGREADAEIVTAAAILHDIGIQAAERKYGSNSGRYQEIEGPPIAARILDAAGFPAAKREEVLAIIGHHHSPGKVKTANFDILYRADGLVNRQEGQKDGAT